MKLKLFNNIVDSPATDMVDMGIFSPGKDDAMDVDEVELLMTPVGKRRQPQPELFDEDSGLGVDRIVNDDVFLSEQDSDNSFQLRRPDHIKPRSFQSLTSAFYSKRCITEEDDVIIPPSKTRRDHTPIKKHYSFEDAFAQKRFHGDCDDDNDVKTIVNRFEEDDDLVADGSMSYCLPTVRGKHSDLKSITPHTLSDLLSGVYDGVVDSCRIIDCRYPYEYEGGHVKGAENVYEKENILDLLRDQSPSSKDGQRHILIFYCEFSSERGPKMSRFFRSKDREINSDNYPALCYPEVYLLHNGYKNFYEHEKEFCEPMDYKPMLHRDHGADLRHFRIRSKTWAAGEKRKQCLRF